MTWGHPFQTAWRCGTPVFQAAARKAVLNPEQAARSLSDEISHALQLVMYAAEDVQRLEAAEHQNAVPSASSNVIRQAMDDVRKGRIPADRSEKHLQQAIREAGKFAQSAAVVSLAPASRNPASARMRFQGLRQQLHEHIAEAQSRVAAATGNGATEKGQPDPDSPRANVLLTASIADALTEIDAVFLANKSVEDPVAPLPQPASPLPQEAHVVCLTPRA